MGLYDDVIGALMIATWLSCALWMLEVVAAYTYYGPKGTASGDTKYMKIIVAAIIIVDTLNLAIACLDTYEYTVTHYGEPSYLLKQYWRTSFWIASGQFVGTAVQTFLVYRYIRLSKNWYIGSVLMLLILIAFGASIACAILITKWSDYSQRILFDKPVKVLITADASADVTIALAIVYQLWGKQGGFKNSNFMIYHLIVNTIQSGALTSLIAVGALVAYLAKPASNVPVIFYWILNRFYVITLLFTLNLRNSLRHGMNNVSICGNRERGDSRASSGIGSESTIKMHIIRRTDTDAEPALELGAIANNNSDLMFPSTKEAS